MEPFAHAPAKWEPFAHVPVKWEDARDAVSEAFAALRGAPNSGGIRPTLPVLYSLVKNAAVHMREVKFRSHIICELSMALGADMRSGAQVGTCERACLDVCSYTFDPWRQSLAELAMRGNEDTEGTLKMMVEDSRARAASIRVGALERVVSHQPPLQELRGAVEEFRRASAAGDLARKREAFLLVHFLRGAVRGMWAEACSGARDVAEAARLEFDAADMELGVSVMMRRRRTSTGRE